MVLVTDQRCFLTVVYNHHLMISIIRKKRSYGGVATVATLLFLTVGCNTATNKLLHTSDSSLTVTKDSFILSVYRTYYDPTNKVLTLVSSNQIKFTNDP
jgi:hypothetical protein